jgi:phosphoesterase RecJ-like protein
VHGTGAPLGRFTTEIPPDALEAAAKVATVIRRCQRILVVGHAGADGDVCGSSLALATALTEMGKDVVVYNEEPYPEAYRWLPGGERVRNTLGEDERFDATLVVDAAKPDRLGRDFPTDRRRRGTYVWIDHHKIEHPPGDVPFIDLTSAAVGEQVAMILDALGHPISASTAQCLYASLLADTGGFRYGNTSARAFRLAARLVEAGVDPWAMTERIYESQDEAKLRLLGRALSRLWMSTCGRVGVVEVTAEDLSASGATDDHVQGLVNHVRGIRGVEIAVLLFELPAGTRVIVRSRGNVAVAPIAASLGAHGHKNAASFSLEEAPERARESVVSAVMGALPPQRLTARPRRTEPRKGDKREKRERIARPAE